jgi:cation:H+ antiporter
MLAIGLCVLVAGGTLVVANAVSLAARAGVPPMLVGILIVGFGTSAPELTTAATAGLTGHAPLAYGNAVGANIANLLVVPAAAALIRPFAVDRAGTRPELAAAGGAMLVLAAGTWLGLPARLHGLLLVATLAGYLAMRLRRASGARGTPVPAPPPAGRRWLVGSEIPAAVLFLTFGIAALVAGADLLVGAGEAIARRWGVPEALIGLTVVAFGTCLPEAVTAVVAARRGEPDIVIGNVLGSCLFNALAVMAAALLLSGAPVPRGIAWIDMPVMLAAAVLVAATVARAGGIARRPAALLLALYLAFVTTRMLTG